MNLKLVSSEEQCRPPLADMRKIEPKSAVFYLLWILFVLFLVYAVIGFIGFWLGYLFVLYFGWMQSALISALLLTTVIIAFRRKIALDAREQVVLNLLFPMTIWFQLYLFFICFIEDSYLQSIFCILFGMIAIVSMICLFFRYRFCIPLKFICGTISVILMGIWILVACFLTCFTLVGLFESTFGEFGKTSVVKQVSSPNQKYIAEVVDIDEGALGGKTKVNVKKAGQQKQQKQRKEIPILVGKLVSETMEEDGKEFVETVYEGSWGEFKTMDIDWKDNHILVIDGKEYAVD